MRKIFASLFVLSVAFASQAQITISSANVLPVGTVVIQNPIAESNYNRIPLTTGANQTWDWSQLADTTGADTIVSVATSSTPYAANFPNANRALKLNANVAGNTSDLFLYYNIGPQAVSVEGFQVQFSVNMGGALIESKSVNRQFSPNQQSRFPEQYQNDYSFPYNQHDSSLNVVSAGGVVISNTSKYETRTGTIRVEVVGWGNLILRTGTIPVLMKRTTETYKLREFEFDTQLAQFVKTDSSDVVDIRYSWVSSDAVYEVAIASLEPNSTTRISDAHYSTSSGTTSLQRSVAAEAAMSLYPMPAKDVLHIKLDQPVTNGVVLLQDLTGRTLISQPLDGLEGNLNLNGLVSGPYIARIQDQNGAFVATKRVTVVK